MSRVFSKHNEITSLVPSSLFEYSPLTYIIRNANNRLTDTLYPDFYVIIFIFKMNIILENSIQSLAGHDMIIQPRNEIHAIRPPLPPTTDQLIRSIPH